MVLMIIVGVLLLFVGFLAKIPVIGSFIPKVFAEWFIMPGAVFLITFGVTRKIPLIKKFPYSLIIAIVFTALYYYGYISKWLG